MKPLRPAAAVVTGALAIITTGGLILEIPGVSNAIWGGWAYVYTNPVLVNEGGAAIWGLVEDTEYPAGLSDNVTKTIRKTAVELVPDFGDDMIDFILKGTLKGENLGIDGAWQGTAVFDNGVLKLDFNVFEDLQGKGAGSSMYKTVLEKFGRENIGFVKGEWTMSPMYKNGESVNLTEFNKAIEDKKSLKDAIFSTPSGKWAWKNNFRDFEILPGSIFKSDGTAENIEVLFKDTSQ